MPEKLPQATLGEFDRDIPLAQFARHALKPFFAGDPLENELAAICDEAFDIPVPIVNVDPSRLSLKSLELFHGPTGAFKDFGARFLMRCFSRLAGHGRMTVLAATSGDTGGAVGCAADGQSSVRAVILYPKGRVSEFQERQLTCWGDNVQAIEIDGDFDDCQRLVKAAFCDVSLLNEHRLTSANSINIGRLLPQLAYSAWAAARVHAETGNTPGFIVPSGNLGHGFAVLLARAMGWPVGPVVLATNANRTIRDWNDTGRFEPRPSVPTLANAMDVGNPSNLERVMALPEEARDVRVELVTDTEIEARIKSEYREKRHVWCPHSATAVEAWWRLKDRHERPWIAAATAHPYKFAETVEPLIGRSIEPTPALAAIHDKPTSKIRMRPGLDSLAEALRERAAAA
jgi:threonine synthase